MNRIKRWFLRLFKKITIAEMPFPEGERGKKYVADGIWSYSSEFGYERLDNKITAPPNTPNRNNMLTGRQAGMDTAQAIRDIEKAIGYERPPPIKFTQEQWDAAQNNYDTYTMGDGIHHELPPFVKDWLIEKGLINKEDIEKTKKELKK